MSFFSFGFIRSDPDRYFNHWKMIRNTILNVCRIERNFEWRRPVKSWLRILAFLLALSCFIAIPCGFVSSASLSLIYQNGWNYCDKCHGLFFDDGAGSSCPGGGDHHIGGGNYSLFFSSVKLGGQPGWKFCNKCKILFFSGGSNSCPVGSHHDASTSGDYQVFTSSPVPRLPVKGWQAGWKWCKKCSALFFSGTKGSVCPSDYKEHDASASGDYSMVTKFIVPPATEVLAATTAAEAGAALSAAQCQKSLLPEEMTCDTEQGLQMCLGYMAQNLIQGCFLKDSPEKGARVASMENAKKLLTSNNCIEKSAGAYSCPDNYLNHCLWYKNGGVVNECFSGQETTAAKTVFVAGEQKFEYQGGEVQSTVVPANLKPASCPKGRLLVTNDMKLYNNSPQSPAAGMVLGWDLDGKSASPLLATFDAPPDPDNHLFCTNDHDIVTLTNGDVLFATGAASRSPIDPKPAWWNDTMRGDFGPGARTVLLVWKSVDCGKTFQYLSELDSATMDDGSCAYPQYRQDAAGQIIDEKPYDMGGSDGQLVKLNRNNNDLYLTFQCVGYKPDAASADFKLSKTRLDKTLLAVAPKGSDWQSLGFLGKREWRLGIVPVTADRVALGFKEYITFINKGDDGYTFEDAIPISQGSWGWQDPGTADHKPLTAGDLIKTNMIATTVISASPGLKSIILAYPGTIDQLSHGYRVFFYNRESNQYAESDAVVPVKPSSSSFIMHLTMIQPTGGGPVLLYWYDVDSSSKTARIRGRLISDEQEYSADFEISKAFSLSSMSSSMPYWYGDYLTAGGIKDLSTSGNSRYTYYPVWIEPDQKITFTRVVYPAVGIAPADAIVLSTKALGAKQWKAVSHVKLEDIQYTKKEMDSIMDYGKRRNVSTNPTKLFPIILPTVPVASEQVQPGWRWCNKCGGLFFSGASGKCSAGGIHDGSKSGKYVLTHGSATGKGAWQRGWNWCKKCSGLFFAGNANSNCPVDHQAHDGSGSGNYKVYTAESPGAQPGWKWCHKCQSLFFGGNPNTSCPAGGAHDGTGSGAYFVREE